MATTIPRVKRVKRDPADPAKLLLEPVPASTDRRRLSARPSAQRSASARSGPARKPSAFPDNWTIGMSFLHNLFAREHNSFVDEFRKQAAQTPNADCGLRNPSDPKQVIRYKDVTPDELFEVARLVVAAEIAKIHTTEWTPQLLYNEPLYKGMNANWNGLLGDRRPDVSKALSDIVVQELRHVHRRRQSRRSGTRSSPPAPASSASAAQVHGYDITEPDSINGGVNHFGSPFNFPEEFVTVYRLHPLVPDLIEYRDLHKDPNKIVEKVAVIDTFEGKATDAMRTGGMANWGLSMGRQRLGLLTLHNHPQFMQNLKMPRLDSPTQQIDLAALDIIRDREHGVPRFNEFRRQYGLRQLTSYDDFMDQPLACRLARPQAPAGDRRPAPRGLRHARLRRIKGDHRRAGERRRNADQRLPRPSQRLRRRQHRRRRHRRRLARRIHTPARLRHLAKRSSWSSSSTPRAASSATAFSPPASVPSSTPH